MKLRLSLNLKLRQWSSRRAFEWHIGKRKIERVFRPRVRHCQTAPCAKSDCVKMYKCITQLVGSTNGVWIHTLPLLVHHGLCHIEMKSGLSSLSSAASPCGFKYNCIIAIKPSSSADLPLLDATTGILGAPRDLSSREPIAKKRNGGK